MINPLKALLFLLSGTTVAGVGAYATGALDPFLNPPTAAGIAALPEQTPDPAATTDDAAPKEDRVETPPAAGTAAEQPAATDQKPTDAPEVAAIDPNAPGPQPTPDPVVPVAGPIVPTFDLVRVEADGSMVIAGHAAPKATIELISGDVVIGKGAAGDDGDFAIVLDTPLAPGDYQITIRATNPDNSVVTSIQTAIVSVPKDPSGPVLAMIQEPGKPSEIITAPQPTNVADASVDQPKPAEGTTVAAPEKPVETAAEQPKPTAEPTPTIEEKPADTAAAPPSDTTATPPADTTATPPAGAAATPPADTTQTPPTETEIAAADPKPQDPTTTQPVKPAIDVAVEAVEIEGRKIFVAGRAPAASTVRVYANDLVLGENKASDASRFLVESEQDLPVGSYVVRADVLGPDGVQVIARAAVPFEREPGENIAAVAPPADAPKPADVADPAKPTTTADAIPPATDNPPAPSDKPAVTADQANPPAGSQDTSPPAAAASTDQPADQKPTDVAAANPPASAPAATEETTAPPLQSVNSAVIIRRGDTLWRISKRVYGRGVRYSTIYLANQDQIRDPDMIWPGQVFSVPDKTREGDQADMSTMGEQATSKTR